MTEASVSLYDIAGRLVRTIATGSYESGLHVTRWDGNDETGHKAAAGLYFLRISRSWGETTQIKVVVTH